MVGKTVNTGLTAIFDERFLASLKFFFSIDSTEYLSSFFEKIDEIGFLEFESDLSKFDEHPFAVANKNITHIIVNNFFSITF